MLLILWCKNWMTVWVIWLPPLLRLYLPLNLKKSECFSIRILMPSSLLSSQKRDFPAQFCERAMMKVSPPFRYSFLLHSLDLLSVDAAINSCTWGADSLRLNPGFITHRLEEPEQVASTLYSCVSSTLS